MAAVGGRRSAAPRLARRVLSDAQRQWVLRLRDQVEKPLLKAQMRQRVNLDVLARYYGTDKSSHTHGYTRLYSRHFAPRRLAVRRLLEIGVGGTDSWSGYATSAGGQSLRMWADYFPNAEIVGIDIYAKAIGGPRINFEQGDQSDLGFLRELIEKHGPFDVVIDDGSHVGRHIRASFAVLWPALTPGGIYVIEDLRTAYDPNYEGGPPGTPGTAAELIKGAVDDTLFGGSDAASPSIGAMHLYSDIVFFEKSR
jgi:hypothetical protein